MSMFSLISQLKQQKRHTAKDTRRRSSHKRVAVLTHGSEIALN